MPALRALPPGWLGRPLLGWTRDRIRAYLARHGIRPVEDPSNRDPAPDRNHLRLRVLPAVAERWPGYRRAILGAAGWQRSAAGAVAMRARADWQRACRRSASGEALLSVREWLELDPRRGRAAIRHWCSLLGLDEPPGERTAAFREQCANARRDAQPMLDWPPAQLHAWRGRIWLDRKPLPPMDWSATWSDRRPLPLPAGGTLLWRGPAGAEDVPWHVGPAPPGARLRLRPGGHRRRAADLMREAGMPPWRRHALPALCVGGELVALGPDWIDADWARSVAPGEAPLAWRARPRGLLPSGVGTS
jgi:tRNA(Ile)-lysidine synthase